RCGAGVLGREKLKLNRGAHVDEDQHIHVSELPAFCAAGSPLRRCAEILPSPAASDVNPELRKATYGLPVTRDALPSRHCPMDHAADRKENNIGPGNLGLEQPAPGLTELVVL